MNDRLCRRCGAVTPGRLVLRDAWGERCWSCGDANSCVDAPTRTSSRPGLPTRVARGGGPDEALHAEADPFRLASRILRSRLWHNPAGYASLAMGCYLR